jgi:hypothetical protein
MVTARPVRRVGALPCDQRQKGPPLGRRRLVCEAPGEPHIEPGIGDHAVVFAIGSSANASQIAGHQVTQGLAALLPRLDQRQPGG